jgi:hypothetical protein
MTPKLADDQRHAIEERGGTPVYIVDPTTDSSYVLLRAEQYERLKAIASGADIENPLSGDASNPPAQRSTANDRGEDAAKHPPNLVALAILKQVKERQRDRKPSDSSKTQDYLREARAGGIYGYGDTE